MSLLRHRHIFGAPVQEFLWINDFFTCWTQGAHSNIHSPLAINCPMVLERLQNHSTDWTNGSFPVSCFGYYFGSSPFFFGPPCNLPNASHFRRTSPQLWQDPALDAHRSGGRKKKRRWKQRVSRCVPRSQASMTYHQDLFLLLFEIFVHLEICFFFWSDVFWLEIRFPVPPMGHQFVHLTKMRNLALTFFDRLHFLRGACTAMCFCSL